MSIPLLLAMYLAELLAIIGVGAAAAWIGYRLAARGRWVAFVVAPPALAVLWLETLAYHVWPTLYQIPQPVAITFSLIQASAFVLLGASLRLITGHLHSRVLLAILGGLVAFFVLKEPASLLTIGPEYASAPPLDVGGHFMQTTPETCAPTCAANALVALGADVTEADMAIYCRTSFWGTNRFQLLRGIRAAGRDHGLDLDVRVHTGLDLAALSRMQPPAILSVLIDDIGHAILYLGPDPQDPSKMLISDPRLPLLVPAEPQEWLKGRYRWAGQAVTIRTR